jgi:hypothetical protein
MWVWGDPGIQRRIILRCIFRKWDVGVWNWIQLVQDTDIWQALVDAAMNVRVP